MTSFWFTKASKPLALQESDIFQKVGLSFNPVSILSDNFLPVSIPSYRKRITPLRRSSDVNVVWGFLTVYDCCVHLKSSVVATPPQFQQQSCLQPDGRSQHQRCVVPVTHTFSFPKILHKSLSSSVVNIRSKVVMLFPLQRSPTVRIIYCTFLSPIICFATSWTFTGFPSFGFKFRVTRGAGYIVHFIAFSA